MGRLVGGRVGRWLVGGWVVDGWGAAKMAAFHAGGSQLVATEAAVAVNCDPPGGGRGATALTCGSAGRLALPQGN